MENNLSPRPSDARAAEVARRPDLTVTSRFGSGQVCCAPIGFLLIDLDYYEGSYGYYG
jgi:hypothetical protein